MLGGSAAYEEKGIVPQAIRLIKARAPKLLVITDLCFCSYTDHGHCGLLKVEAGEQTVDNDRSLSLLVRQALVHARAGSDILAPSCMLDGMVSALRRGLDTQGYTQLPILSYAVKFCSHLYQPFRTAAQGSPKQGHRAGYQLDFTQAEQALREAELDILEGADLLMVKPAHTYLDIIHRVHQAHLATPLVAYHVSGECALLKAGAQQGWINEREAVMEVLLGIKRAGAQWVISYYAKKVASWLKDGETVQNQVIDNT